MIFSLPALLWALPLALGPLLLHLLALRRARRQPFSDLSLARRAHARALPRARLRQWLLVAARCGLLALLILAYAGPVVRGVASGGEAGLDLVLLVDVSYSMGARERGKTRLDLLKAEAEPLLRALRPADRVALAAFSDRVESTLEWRGPREASAALAGLRPGFRGTDYAPALRAAGEFLRGAEADPARRRVVLVLSDGARHGARGPWPELDARVLWLGVEWPGLPNARLHWAGPSSESRAASPRLLARAQGVAGPAGLELWVEGRRAQTAALPGTGPERIAALPLPPAREARRPAWSGVVELRPDALSADDAYYFSFSHPARPRLLCLYGNPGFFKAPAFGYFLKELLGSGGESLLDIDCDFLELSRFPEARLSEYAAVLLADFGAVPAPTISELDRFARAGGGLWVLPGPRTPEAALASLEPMLPVRFGPLVAGEAGGLRLGPAAPPRPWKDFDLARVTLPPYHLLRVMPGGGTWLRSASGYPLLAVGARGGGRVAIWAGPLDAATTNLPLKPLFVPLVEAVLEELVPGARRRQEALDLRVGQALIRSWPAELPAPDRVLIRVPDGRSHTLWVRERRVEFADTSAPGLYTVTEEGTGRRHVYAVNLDRSGGESELTPLRDPPWRTLSPEDLAASFRREVYGKDIRNGALALAAALFVLEMFLAIPLSAPSRRERTAPSVAFVGILLLPLLCARAAAQYGDRLVWTQLRVGPDWDPYPNVHAEIFGMLSTVTSVLTHPDRRAITLRDRELFFSPIVILAGRQAPPPLDDDELRQLRNYLGAGGVLWIEDVSGLAASSFDRWVRHVLRQALPETELAPLPAEHVVYRTFFLLRGEPAGRVSTRGLEGISWAGRTAVVYSRGDLLGIWLKDALGSPLYPCVPGGEAQRHAGRKLAVNILMYALTGSYKADAVHQPYLLQKMRSGAP